MSLEVQPPADDGAAVADLGAVLVEEGEGERAVDRIEIDAAVERQR